MELFDLDPTTPSPAETVAPSWVSLTDSAERLAALVADRSYPPARRSEADGALRIYRQRLADLEVRLALGQPEIVPLGVLMILPEDGRGA